MSLFGEIAGKTGTAELADAASHAWSIGFAPHKIAYGGTASAPAAAIVNAAVKLGLVHP